MIPLVLASQSPARLATLRSAGMDPEVIVSHVDEDAVLSAARAADARITPADEVLVLARAKADAVAAAHDTGAIIVACDSMLEINGQVVGKPGTAAAARDRWRAMRGGIGTLHSGHWLIDDRAAEDGGTHATLGATSSTVVHFADLSDAEIDAYVATGEPLHVAGAFTIDSLGGPFVERLEGDPHGVVGISLPLLRHLLADVGVSVPDLWASQPR